MATRPHLRLALGGVVLLAIAGAGADAAWALRRQPVDAEVRQQGAADGSSATARHLPLTPSVLAVVDHQPAAPGAAAPGVAEPGAAVLASRTRQSISVPAAPAAGGGPSRVARHRRSSAAGAPIALRRDGSANSALTESAGSGRTSAGEAGDAPLRAGAHPFERPAASDLRLNDPGRELAIWYDPAEFPSGPVRFALPDQGPACILTVRGTDSAVGQARIDGVPVVPGRSYVVEPGMRFEAPSAVDLQIRPAKPADLPGAPQGAG